MIRRALPLVLLLPAGAFAQVADSTPLFSISAERLSPAEVDDVLAAGAGRYVQVGDRLSDVSAGPAAGDRFLTVPEGEALLKTASLARVARLRAAAREGRLTDADRAEARALDVLRSGLMSWPDRYFLESLHPESLDAQLPPSLPDGLAVPEAPSAPAPAADALAASLRARLTLDDHGDPAQAEALDAAVRLMLKSPAARELAAEFVRLGLRAKVSFEPLEGSILGESYGRKYVLGIGGENARVDGDTVRLNAAYLKTDPAYQFANLPGTLAHELLGHGLNDARADAAGVARAMGLWRGDEATAGVTGWLVQAEVDGKVPEDSYLWSFLTDPEEYHRSLHLVTSYYARSLSADEAGRVDAVYAERLDRVNARVAEIRAELADKTDWAAILDHFEKVHRVDPWRLQGMRDQLAHPATAQYQLELDRLEEVRRALTADLAALKDPARRSDITDAAKGLGDPFFVESQKRLDALAARLRALADAQRVSTAESKPDPHVTIIYSLGWDELKKMYADDLRDHPEHWPSLASAAPPSYTSVK